MARRLSVTDDWLEANRPDCDISAKYPEDAAKRPLRRANKDNYSVKHDSRVTQVVNHRFAREVELQIYAPDPRANSIIQIPDLWFARDGNGNKGKSWFVQKPSLPAAIC
jgi:hypothetical protein